MKSETKKRIETIKLMQRKKLPGETVGLLIQRGLKALDDVTDTVLAHHPKPQSKPAKKRARRKKKAQRESCI